MPILVDIIMIGLLIGVIIHSVRLTQSLANFKQLHSEMLPMMKNYAKTLIETQGQILELKKVSGEVDHIINSRIPPALMIKSDLDFLVSRANELADHLEAVITQSRLKEFPVKSKDLRPTKSEVKSPKIKKSESSVKLKAIKEDRLGIITEAKISEVKKTAIESFFPVKTKKNVKKKVQTNAA